MPVIVSASRFSRMPELQKFQAINDPKRPLTDLGRNEQEKIWDRVVQKIEDVFLGETAVSNEAAGEVRRVDSVQGTRTETAVPTFRAEFVLESDGKIRRSGRNYENYNIRLFIEDAPAATRKVRYELHETYLQPIREVVKGQRDFEEYITSYGDFIVNIKLIGEDEINLNDWLSSALHNYYGSRVSDEIARAIKAIEDN